MISTYESSNETDNRPWYEVRGLYHPDKFLSKGYDKHGFRKTRSPLVNRAVELVVDNLPVERIYITGPTARGNIMGDTVSMFVVLWVEDCRWKRSEIYSLLASEGICAHVDVASAPRMLGIKDESDYYDKVEGELVYVQGKA